MQSARLLVAVGVVSLFGLRAHEARRRRRRRRHQHRQHSAGHLHRRSGECDRDLEHRQRDGRGDPRRRRHPADAERAGHCGRDPAGDALPRHQHRQRSRDLPAADDQRASAATNSIPSPPRPLSTSTPTRSGDLSPGDTPYVVGSNDPVLECRRLRDRAGGQRHSRRRRRRQPRLLAPARPTRAPACGAPGTDLRRPGRQRHRCGGRHHRRRRRSHGRVPGRRHRRERASRRRRSPTSSAARARFRARASTTPSS